MLTTWKRFATSSTTSGGPASVTAYERRDRRAKDHFSAAMRLAGPSRPVDGRPRLQNELPASGCGGSQHYSCLRNRAQSGQHVDTKETLGDSERVPRVLRHPYAASKSSSRVWARSSKRWWGFATSRCIGIGIWTWISCKQSLRRTSMTY